jgi:hypothetical protein
MKFNFREWFLIENTVSQLIKANPLAPQIMQWVTSEISTVRWTRNTTENDTLPIKKLLVYWIGKEIKSKATDKQAYTNSQLQNYARDLTYRFTRDSADYLVYLMKDQPNLMRSKFNNSQYLPTDLVKDSEAWHEKLTQQERLGADPGRKVEIAGMPAGYYWVCLDKESCDKEGSAMGHCGNAGAKHGDMVWSMRDPKGVPHLTFIVNEKQLGESKGYGNNKPEAKYHPHIAAILLGTDNGNSIIDYIKGGGYKPEANFHFDDFDEATQKRVLAAKPYIQSYFDYLKHTAGNDPEKFKEKIGEALGFKFDSVDMAKQNVILKKFDDIDKMTQFLQNETGSDVKELPDFDNMHDWDHDVDTEDAIRTFENEADSKNQALMDEIIKLLGGDVEIKTDDDDEDYEEDHDVSWAANENDSVNSALLHSASDGYRIGAESDAYKSVQSFMSNEKDENGHGFYLEMPDKHHYTIEISMKDLEALYKANDWEYENFADEIVFKYEAPYNGFSGFDDEGYNERLGEMLADAKDEIASEKVKS